MSDLYDWLRDGTGKLGGVFKIRWEDYSDMNWCYHEEEGRSMYRPISQCTNPECVCAYVLNQ